MPRLFASLSAASLIAALCMFSAPAASAQNNPDDQDKGVDVKSSVGDLHMGNDGNPREVGLPVYPGARIRKDIASKDNSNANLSLFTQSFGWKLVVVNFDSDDSPNKVIAYYRDKLKKYGKVLECHTKEHGGGVDIHDDNDSNKSKELKCEDDNTGPVVELKVGTEDNQHVVAIEAADSGKGSTFALVYVRTRGEQADI